MSEKDMFLTEWDREFGTTMKLLKNYPGDKVEMKPSDRSRSAREIAWTFTTEIGVIDMAIEGKFDFARLSSKPPQSIKELIASLESASQRMIDRVKNMSTADYNSTVKFPVGPGAMADMRKADVMWFTIKDLIHHRGQFSVYLRMAGGKVPSIYGPSGDEPWM
jgi:uncharacterized damage-inducible protein DinB